MTILGMPDTMFLVFVATLLAGGLGAIHYVLVHVVLGKPVNEQVSDGTQEAHVADGGRRD